MPAAGWTQLRNGSFRYRDPGQILGPVRAAGLRGGRLAKVVARGAGIGFTLDEGSQGTLAVALTSGARRYCTFFGGDHKRDDTGAFIAGKAAPPATCP